MKRAVPWSTLSGELLQQHQLSKSLAGIGGGKNVGTPMTAQPSNNGAVDTRVGWWVMRNVVARGGGVGWLGPCGCQASLDHLNVLSATVHIPPRCRAVCQHFVDVLDILHTPAFEPAIQRRDTLIRIDRTVPPKNVLQLQQLPQASRRTPRR